MEKEIIPRSAYVVAVPETAETKTANGIYIPPSAAQKQTTAVVVAVSDGVKDLKSGDRIVYKNYTTSDIILDGKKYLLIKDEDVIATIK